MGFEIREVPISYYPRKTDQGKKIRFSDGFAGFLVALFWRFAPLGKLRKQCGAVSEDLQKVIRKKQQTNLLFLALFVFAFLLRLGCAMPGILSNGQKLLMYVDSYPFLAMAGKGFIHEKPKLCTPYPSGFRAARQDHAALPPWEKGINDQTRAPLYVLWLSFLSGISTRNLIFIAVMGCIDSVADQDFNSRVLLYKSQLSVGDDGV